MLRLKLANPICSWWKDSWLQKGEDKPVSLDLCLSFVFVGCLSSSSPKGLHFLKVRYARKTSMLINLVWMLDATPSTAFLPPFSIRAVSILNESRICKSMLSNRQVDLKEFPKLRDLQIRDSFNIDTARIENGGRNAVEGVAFSMEVFRAYLTFRKCRPFGEEDDEHPTKTKDRQTRCVICKFGTHSILILRVLRTGEEMPSKAWHLSSIPRSFGNSFRSTCRLLSID
jgi:hypothetical protein